jgi:hypothetical protein
MKYRVLIEQDEDGFFVAEARNHPTRHVREAGLWCVPALEPSSFADEGVPQLRSSPTVALRVDSVRAI